MNKIFKKAINIIGEQAKVKGNIYSSRPTQVNGLVEGEIISKKKLTIGKSGEVKGNIKTEDALIEGNFLGNLIASGEVRISSTGRFMGNLIKKDSNFTISEGGLFIGKNIIVENEEVFKMNGHEKIVDIKIKAKKTITFPPPKN